MLRTSAYEAAAKGEISKDTLGYLEKVSSLEGSSLRDLLGALSSAKEAAVPRMPPLAPTTRDALVYGLSMAGAPLVAGAAYGLGAKIKDKLTAPGDLKKILKVHPNLAQAYPSSDIDLAFKSVRRFAPEITKDPLAGGNALGMILRARDPLQPSAPPDISGANIAESFGRVRAMHDPARESVMNAATAGTGAGLRIRELAREHQRRLEAQDILQTRKEEFAKAQAQARPSMAVGD